MEALAAISLVGNIYQFLEFSELLISRSVKLHRFRNGTLPEYADLEAVTRHLISLNTNLQTSTASTDEGLQKLCISCKDLADELLKALEQLRQNGERGMVMNIRKALRSMWKEKDIQRLDQRLKRFREELSLNTIVDLRYVFSQDSYLAQLNRAAGNKAHESGPTN